MVLFSACMEDTPAFLTFWAVVVSSLDRVELAAGIRTVTAESSNNVSNGGLIIFKGVSIVVMPGIFDIRYLFWVRVVAARAALEQDTPALIIFPDVAEDLEVVDRTPEFSGYQVLAALWQLVGVIADLAFQLAKVLHEVHVSLAFPALREGFRKFVYVGSKAERGKALGEKFIHLLDVLLELGKLGLEDESGLLEDIFELGGAIRYSVAVVLNLGSYVRSH